MSPIWNGRVAWWTYLIAVIDMPNIASTRASRDGTERVPTPLAYWETEPVASLPYTLIMNSSAASRLFSPDPHDPAEISQSELDSDFMRSK